MEAGQRRQAERRRKRHIGCIAAHSQRPSRYTSNQALKSIGAGTCGTRMSPR